MHASSFQRIVIAGIAIALSALLAAACKQVPQNAPAPEAQVPSAAAAAPAAAAAAGAPGRISIQQWPNLTIDGKSLRAAPGARIVNNNNNLMMTPNMVPNGARVQYELDGTGQVRLIRVLDPN